MYFWWFRRGGNLIPPCCGTLKTCMRQAPEYFGESELELVYIAKKLKEALALEDLLTKGGFDYLVEPDRYTGGTIFRTERVGAFFYVTPEAGPSVRTAMVAAGYRPYDETNP